MSEVDNIKLHDEEIKKNLIHYRNVLSYMGANVPIAALCLPKVIENALTRDGCERVYDLINRDLTKIKGLGKNRIDLLTSRLDEFFTVSI
jgi:hypothetical protein